MRLELMYSFVKKGKGDTSGMHAVVFDIHLSLIKRTLVTHALSCATYNIFPTPFCIPVSVELGSISWHSIWPAVRGTSSLTTASRN